MFEYIIRRLLLMIPTFFGTTMLVFFILQSVPDGPFEQAVFQIKMAQMQSGEGGSATFRTTRLYRNRRGGLVFRLVFRHET